jgi:aldose 1-epimerase
MEVKEFKFARLSDGSKVHLYTVNNGSMSFSVTDYGCTITSIKTPDKNGNIQDIALGYSTFDGYLHDDKFFGVFVGRFANRIANAKFSLNGADFKLDKNDGDNCLHSGYDSYNKKIWKAEITETKRGSGVRFTRISPDGEQGFPGTVKIEVIYLLNNQNEIMCRYRAISDKDTPINLTNHSYFNLKGEGSGDVLNHDLTLACDSFLELDDGSIPTGRILSVENTPFDFRTTKKIGDDISKTVNGYDHNFCINQNGRRVTSFAKVSESSSGRKMTVSTNQPGVQFYTGNYLGGDFGKNGHSYAKHSGFCLETQQYPDAPNKKDFPSCILKANDLFEAVTTYSFEW